MAKARGEEPSRGAHELAAKYGLLLRKGRLGWCVYDVETGFVVSDRLGVPAESLEPGFVVLPGFEPFFWSWKWAAERLAVFEHIAAGVQALISAPLRTGGDMVRGIQALPDAAQLTEEAVAALLARCETPMLPEVLYACSLAGADPHVVGAKVGHVWSASEFPDSCLAQESWRDLFDLAAFRVDDQPAPRPATPLRLYRGSVPERRTDWSWTDDWEVAHRFAHEGVGWRPKGRVWTALVPAEALLAHNTRRDEAEWVAEVPEGLIEADSRECGC